MQAFCSSYYLPQPWYVHVPSEYGGEHAYERNHYNYEEEREHQRRHHEYAHVLHIACALGPRQALEKVVRRYVHRPCQRLVRADFRAVRPDGRIVGAVQVALNAVAASLSRRCWELALKSAAHASGRVVRTAGIHRAVSWPLRGVAPAGRRAVLAWQARWYECLAHCARVNRGRRINRNAHPACAWTVHFAAVHVLVVRISYHSA